MKRGVLQDAIRKQTFAWIIVDRPSTNWLPYYIYIDRIFDDPTALLPLMGAPSRPESSMIRIQIARGGSLALEDPALNFRFAQGWSTPETWGNWAVGHTSELNLALEKNYGYQIQFESSTSQSLIFQIPSEWAIDQLSFEFERNSSAARTGTLPEKLPRAATFRVLTFVQQEAR